MSGTKEQQVQDICRSIGTKRRHLMDIARAVQAQFGCVDGDAAETVARELGIHRVEVEGLVSFYAFLSSHPQGKVVIHLCTDIIDELKGAQAVADAPYLLLVYEQDGAQVYALRPDTAHASGD